ncbi:MAG: hypothetical protein ABIJ11_05035 [Elusimicrobiota bacterium]
MNLKKILIKNYPERLYSLVTFAGETASAFGFNAYLVGGCVRDILMNNVSRDIDIALVPAEFHAGANIKGETSRKGETPRKGEMPRKSETPPECRAGIIRRLNGMAAVIKKKYKGSQLKAHPEFGTLSLFLPGGRLSRSNSLSHSVARVDFAIARRERYPSAGSLPAVDFPADIKADLLRRDFTINSIAVCLSGGPSGEVLDFYGGIKDIRDKKINVLHPRSFIDDPTRILRALRFAGRLGFGVGGNTGRLLADAVRKNYPGKVSQERITNEFLLAIGEPDAPHILKLFSKYDINNTIWRELLAGLPGLRKGKGSVLSGMSRLRTVDARLCLLLRVAMPGRGSPGIKNFLRKIKVRRETVRRITGVFEYMSGARQDVLPLWASEFFRIAGFKKPPVLITGHDLLKEGFTPGPLFKKILSEVRANTSLSTRRKALEYINKKYR